MSAIDKSAALIAAAEAGFFRSKNPERKNEIVEELAKAQGWNEAALLEILSAETRRRAEAYRVRVARNVIKAEAEAAKPVSGGVDSHAAHITSIDELRPNHCGRFVLTTAQNNTEADAQFLGALREYCRANNAQLLIAKTTYNKNAYAQPEVSADLWYSPELVPHLVSGHVDLGGGVHFFADANVIPTAKNPLSGFESLTASGVSCVIPAVKIALKATAALDGAPGKLLFATGAVTKRNYILRKAGAVAQSEHNIGALFVKVSGDSFEARQLERMPNSAGFYDEGIFYSAEGSSGEYAATALQFGDIHAEKMTPENKRKCLALIEKYRPQNLVIHDVLDFSSRNHHNIKDPVFMFSQHIQGNTVAGDIAAVSSVLDEFASVLVSAATSTLAPIVHIIESNHDLAINTWLKNADFKIDPVNATVYLSCMLALYQHIEKSGGDTGFNMLAHAYKNIGGGRMGEYIEFHETDESLNIAGVEMGCHGHTGINGSRGSPAQFRTLGVPMNTGHTHTPSICGAVYTAGVSASLDMGYNVGPSSWRLAHILTWPNGQRQIIFA